MMQTTAESNDRWTFDTWFTGFGNTDYTQFKETLVHDIANLKTQVSALQNNPEAIIKAIQAFETLCDRLEHLSNYILCLQAENVSNEPVKKDKAWIATLQAEATKLKTSLQAKLAALSDTVFETVVNNELLEGAKHEVKRMREEGQHLMNTEMEALAADLGINGLHAWGRLYDTLAGQMEFQMTFPDGHREIVPMSRRRALMAGPDRALRQAAFHDGQKPWQDHAETLAACLNGIAGTRLSLYRHRNISNFLDLPLFDSALSRASLEAMLDAIHKNLELPRRALRAAARLQKTPALHYFDLEAPQIVAAEEKPLSWGNACEIVEQSFRSAYPKFGQYFCDMLNNRWIEAEPRADKLPGAFCTGSRFKLEERAFLSFHGTLHDVVTTAHEVGHAWHARVLRPKRSMATHCPMTLAETASNFGEMILLNSLLDDPDISPEKKATLIDQQMLRAHGYLINIPMRFHFEKAFYTERACGELSVSRFCELMEQSQRELYGDTLLSDGTDPFFWASKMHFFITDVSFYNFPYVFGYLLSQALYARFNEEGAAFLPRYEAFLANTGSNTCEEVARNTLGVDLTNPDFWAEALRTIEPALKEYEALGSK